MISIERVQRAIFDLSDVDTSKLSSKDAQAVEGALFRLVEIVRDNGKEVEANLPNKFQW